VQEINSDVLVRHQSMPPCVRLRRKRIFALLGIPAMCLGFLVLSCPILLAQFEFPAPVNNVDIPLYRAEGGFTSTLVINNNWREPIPVSATLYNA